jgi:hypothetical protein
MKGAGHTAQHTELKRSTREFKLPGLAMADTDALGDNSTDIPDSLLRTCAWSRTWPSDACRLQEAFGESSKKQALTQNLFALVLSYVPASGMNFVCCLSMEIT